MKIRKAGSVLLLVLLLWSPTWVKADAIPFTGTATFGNDIENFFLSGPSFSLSSAAPGATASPIVICNQGQFCDPTLTVNAFFTGVPGFSGGTVDGVTAQTLSGSITFSGDPFIAPSAPVGSPVDVSVPVTLLGEITGWGVVPGFGVTDPVFTVLLSGAGTLELSGRVPQAGLDTFRGASWTFAGEAAVTPEGSTLLLLGSGIVSVAAWMRRSRRRLSSRRA